MHGLGWSGRLSKFHTLLETEPMLALPTETKFHQKLLQEVGAKNDCDTRTSDSLPRNLVLVCQAPFLAKQYRIPSSM